jgi:hypothetical protein
LNLESRQFFLHEGKIMRKSHIVLATVLGVSLGAATTQATPSHHNATMLVKKGKHKHKHHRKGKKVTHASAAPSAAGGFQNV